MHFLHSPLGETPIPAWKRAIDLAAVGAALPVLGLCALVLVIVTRLGSPGPILFRQQRIGYRGRPFQLLKFRTMHLNAETGSHQAHVSALLRSNAPMQKLDARHDPRLMPGGWLLRAAGLDELPQLLNVLRGEMSLVGPRPCLPFEYELYTPAERRRCDALPGLTGLWQVSGKNRTTFQTMVELDVAYARRLSLGQDLRIMARTIPVLWRQVAEARRRRHQPARSRPKPNLSTFSHAP